MIQGVFYSTGNIVFFLVHVRVNFVFIGISGILIYNRAQTYFTSRRFNLVYSKMSLMENGRVAFSMKVCLVLISNVAYY